MEGPAGDEAGDRGLVEAFLRRRTEAAFSVLYGRYAPRTYGLIVRLLGPLGGRAEDVFQETWIRAIEGLPRFAWRSSLATWLAGIAVNCCREERRRIGAGEAGDFDAPLEEVALAPGDPLGRVQLGRAIDRLPAGYREVLVLHDVEGFTHEEIAGQLGIDPGTSRSQLHRARRAVREALLRGGVARHE